LSEFDAGVKLVVGLKLRVLQASTITAVRYYKGVGETGTHQGVIYETATGKEVARTNLTLDDTCAGGQWVTLPLQQAFRPALNKDYTVAIDGVSTYTLSEGYTFNNVQGALLPLGGFYNFKPGRMPTIGGGVDNYWVDGESTTFVVLTNANLRRTPTYVKSLLNFINARPVHSA
jgi:hypothetical protein